MKSTYYILALFELLHSLGCVYINTRAKEAKEAKLTAKFQANEVKKKENFGVQFALSILPTLITCAVYNYLVCTSSLQEATERVLADFLLLIPFLATHTGIDKSFLSSTPF